MTSFNTTTPRDMLGYGENPPHAAWPGNARLALQIVVNYEEGGENCVLDGDDASESFLADQVGIEPWVGKRNLNVESIYEYGARAGFWRLFRILQSRKVPVTVFGVTLALARNPLAVAAMKRADWEIACHALRWIDYSAFDRDREQAHVEQALRLHMQCTGSAPAGWYTGRISSHTLALVSAIPGIRYSSDCYADDLPYWVDGSRGPFLMVPYTLDANDMRFSAAQGFNCGDQFYAYLKDTFDMLYEEGLHRPRMMSVGLHCRLAGRPGRARALARFLDYVATHDRVWMARRVDIAEHWHALHPPPAN